MPKMVTVLKSLGFALAGLILVSCARHEIVSNTAPVFHLEDNPQLLSEWNIFSVSSGALSLHDNVVAYDLNSALFTDYAQKLRTIWMPEGAEPAAYRGGDYPDFPVGTVISKTFYYPLAKTDGEAPAVLKFDYPEGQLSPDLTNLTALHLVETRLLVRRDTGWHAVSYVWNKAQTDAVLTKIGDAKPMVLVGSGGDHTDFTYIVPNINQCAGCHALNNTTRTLEPLGVRPRHINKLYTYGAEPQNQLLFLEAKAYLSGAPASEDIQTNVNWRDNSQPLDLRARAYLDINCSHCHNPVGPADTSGLDLTMDAPVGPALGICKLPIAAGAGTGGRPFDIVPGNAEASILLHRMEIDDPGAMMPELGRSLVHKEGVELIRAWINGMQGSCSS